MEENKAIPLHTKVCGVSLPTRMKVEELKKNIRKVSALIEVYDETIQGSGSAVELGITKEQIITALVDTKKVLLKMERETKNV